MGDSSPQAETLLSYQQAAEILGTATTFLERLVSTRGIACIRVGHYVRIRRSDLDDYIERSRVPAAGE